MLAELAALWRPDIPAERNAGLPRQGSASRTRAIEAELRRRIAAAATAGGPCSGAGRPAAGAPVPGIR